MGCTLVLGLLWLALASIKVADPEWFSGSAVRTYLAKVTKVTGPSDRTFLPIVDYLLYAGGMNRVFRLAGGAGAMVATGLFLAELGAGLCLVVGAIRSKRRWRWTGLLASASLCLMLGLSGASRLTALLSALTITVSALHATVRPRHRDAA